MGDADTGRAKAAIRTVDLVYIALAVALTAVCSWISIPTAVPFTMQTFAVFAVLLILGGERGTAAVAVYVLAGACGLPVFSGFKGGAGALLGNTGGYILGFIFMGLVHMLITRLAGSSLITNIISLTAGLAVCYAFGTAWFMFMYIRNTGPVGLYTVLTWCVFPFIIPDILKMTLAFVISERVRPHLAG